MKLSPCAIALVAFVSLALNLCAQTVPAEGELGSRDLSVRKQAVKALHDCLAANLRGNVTEIYNRRLPTVLMAVNENDVAAEVALQCINGQPDRIERAEYFMTVRVQALLAAKKNQEALAAAKSLYNACLIKSTPKAIELVAQCLAAAYPNDPGKARRFKFQQLATSEEEQKQFGEPVLKEIQVEGSIYDGAGLSAEHNGDAQWLGQANLYLMKDQPDKAREIFERLVKIDNITISTAARAGIARAIKAKTGMVAPANAYLLADSSTTKPAIP